MNIEITNLQPGTDYVLHYTLKECGYIFHDVTVPFITDATGRVLVVLREQW